MSKESNSVNVSFVRSPSYTRHRVTGVWGGVSTDGLCVSCELIEDIPAIPNSVQYEINSSGKIVGETVHASESQINRYIHAGLSIPIESIPVITRWLNEKYEEHMRNKAGANHDSL